MNMLNATWISAMLQPCAFCIGLTNSVHEYCRLAISTMQSTPSHNCSQRPEGGALVCDMLNLPGCRRSMTVGPRLRYVTEATQSTSRLLEIDPLDDGQALKLTAQAVERQFNRAETQPFASTQDA